MFVMNQDGNPGITRARAGVDSHKVFESPGFLEQGLGLIHAKR